MDTNATTLPLVSPSEVKAIAHAHAGRRPTLVTVTGHPWETIRSYTVPSSRGAATYNVDLIGNPAGLLTRCTCPAGLAGRECWHQTAVLLDHFGALPTVAPAATGEPAHVEPVITATIAGRQITVTATDLFGPRRRSA